MHHILVINSSASKDLSVSRDLVAYAVQHLIEARPGTTLKYRDVGLDVIPHLTPATIAGVRAVAETQAEQATRALSDELVAELQLADVIVIGAPMYNFSIPSTLRTWFDHVLRPRVTFAYSPEGPKGLLTGKKAIVIEPRGGAYSEGPAKAIDFQEPYLRQLLGFIGIRDVAFIHAEKIGFGPEEREQAMAAARARIAAAVDRLDSPSALPAAAPAPPVDYDALLQANLMRVFNQHDAARRIDAIRTLYHRDAELHEPSGSAQGHEAISRAVAELLAHLPPGLAFRAVRPAVGHHGAGRLQWCAELPDGTVAVTGTDVAQVQDGLIRSLHVFLDQRPM